MSDIILRDATAADWADVLALNQAHRPHVGALTPIGLRQLHEQAIYFRLAEATGTLVGFLIALDPLAEYGSLNFLWFKTRYERFVYIDRIAVVAAKRRCGIARHLYEDLERFAGARGFDLQGFEGGQDLSGCGSVGLVAQRQQAGHGYMRSVGIVGPLHGRLLGSTRMLAILSQLDLLGRGD
ncbi:GNAT family N-acetyltransferase [Candidatus Competibacter phosphatis]|uniref:GNAT family N-acetyltransferase n=1 Tax=Candidatus Competibacter phosphatis TaxID=221280 RepID=UPI001B7F3811|nr:GNAT family N-acetyltransferase [Candidatus Competibacter phosphatis]